MNTIIQQQNNITITDHNTATTLSRDAWVTIVEAVNFLSLQGSTLAELQQVAKNFEHKPEYIQNLFWMEFWAMIGYNTAKGVK